MFPELRFVRLWVNWVEGSWAWYFGTFPYILRMLGILLDYGQDTGRDYAVGSAEIVIDFCMLSVNRVS